MHDIDLIQLEEAMNEIEYMIEEALESGQAVYASGLQDALTKLKELNVMLI